MPTMSRTLVACVLFAGCADNVSAPVITPGTEPRTCAMQLTLDGSAGSAPNVVGPLTLDTSGADLCLHLDATHNTRVHFAASTPYEAGPASSYTATLEDTAYGAILDGWDVTVGNTDPHTFLNVEWNPPAGQTTNVILWVRSVAGTTPTTINLALFDPLE